MVKVIGIEFTDEEYINILNHVKRNTDRWQNMDYRERQELIRSFKKVR